MKKVLSCAAILILCAAMNIPAQDKQRLEWGDPFAIHVTSSKDEGDGRLMGYGVNAESDTATFKIRCYSLRTLLNQEGSPRIPPPFLGYDLNSGDCSQLAIGNYTVRRLGRFIGFKEQQAVYFVEEEVEKSKPASGLISGGNIYSTRQHYSGITPLNIILFLLWILTLMWGALWRTAKGRSPGPTSKSGQPAPSHPRDSL